MAPGRSLKLRAVQVLATIVIFRTVAVVFFSFGDYFPPNFHSDFLLGREAYFFGVYQWAFYAHIVSGPVCLIAGLALLSESLRRGLPRLHRVLGRVHVATVLLLLAPSGLWMAWYTETGAVAAAGFATLAMLTAVFAVLGWRAAVARRFDEHRAWMQRCYALLCSAVVVRAIGGAAEVYGWEGTYPLAAWLGWIVPLLALECSRASWRGVRRRRWSASRGVLPGSGHLG